MNASSVLSDTQAREIAAGQIEQGLAFTNSPLGVFAETGEILASLANAARAGDDLLHPSLRIGEDFWSYVAFHGERGPVDSWSEL